MILGLVMFEVFHDVQYLSIVWLFNVRRVETDPGVGSFTRFVFRRSWGMLGIYLGLVLVYGGFMPATRGFVQTDAGAFLVTTVVTTSALLHYYFDGFIWKVRESSTRASLGLAGGGVGDLRVSTHALKWLLLLVPAAVFWVTESRSAPSLERALQLQQSTPGAAQANLKLGVALNGAGRRKEAEAAIVRAVALRPGDRDLRTALAVCRYDLALDQLRNNDARAAEATLRAALPDFPDLVTTCNDKGVALWRAGDLPNAVANLRAALLLDPDMAEAHLNLALVYRDAGAQQQALLHAKRGATLRPEDKEAHNLVQSLSR